MGIVLEGGGVLISLRMAIFDLFSKGNIIRMSTAFHLPNLQIVVKHLQG